MRFTKGSCSFGSIILTGTKDTCKVANIKYRWRMLESEEYKELKAEIEAIKKHVAKLEKELLNVKRLAQEALDAAAML
jgi:cell division protein FtsB